MGTIYSVGCRDCKVTRDLDKFYGCHSVDGRKEALALTEDFKDRYAYRSVLLASFMAEHMGHNCTVFTEHMDSVSEELDPYHGNAKSDDRDFWDTQETKPPEQPK